jgi:hypothetical protein
MVVVGFILKTYEESGQLCWGYCHLGCGLELCGIGSLYLSWFLWGELISDSAAEIVMV